ncbi:MAG: TRAP transporter small permease subunit [Acetobacteraceae bacterium]|nr:TRAP transporter small permease subunit [Acetobacteraceae bacterium]
MQAVLLGIDRLSSAIGKLFAWCVVLLTLVVAYEVLARKLFRAPTTWGYDAAYMLYGTLFMMAGAYALSRNGHVRGDFLYRNWRPRIQAGVDLVLYFLFFFPGIIAFIYSGWDFFHASFLQNERSMFSPVGPVIWPFKGLIPVVGVLLLVQGFAEVVRAIRCLSAGEWPARLSDVQEMDQLILQQAEEDRERALATRQEEAGLGRGDI